MMEKQIEEMARAMCRSYKGNGVCNADESLCNLECLYGYCAERAYCVGYRKQNTELEKVIQMLDTEYERAKNMEYVKKPLAWALYQVWKKIDAKEGGEDE